MSSYIVGSGLDFLITLVRYRISDLKSVYNNVVQEDAGVCSGVTNEIFATDNMPIASGFSTVLRAGRWAYSEVASDAEGSALRAYTFNTTSGYFRIASNAILPTAGDRIKLSYTWSEEQPYKFSDGEIGMYLGDAVTEVNGSWYDFGHSFSANSVTNALAITPVPDPSSISSYLYAHYASYLMKKQLESEGFGDRIYVRDINITIDTSKGLGDLQKSSKDLLSMFEKIINTLRLRSQAQAWAVIDTYSSYPTYLRRYEVNFNKNDEFF